MPVWDQLPNKWADMCRTADTSRFTWAHNGSNKNGWIELHDDGKVTTPWCEGSWKAVEDDADVVEMTFGSCRHMCRFREGGFLVEQRISKRTGNDTYKPDQAKSCAWIGAPPPRAPGEAKASRVKADASDDKPQKRKKDPNAPKQPAGGAFGCFLAANREAFAKECPNNVIAGVTKLASTKWKEISEEEKKTYQEQYQAKKAEYEKAMSDYKKNLQAGDVNAAAAAETKKKPAADEVEMIAGTKRKPPADDAAMRKKPAITTDMKKRPAKK
jgi:hypothetical protein